MKVSSIGSYKLEGEITLSYFYTAMVSGVGWGGVSWDRGSGPIRSPFSKR